MEREQPANCRVVLPSGQPIALAPPAGQPGESALALRLRIGASLNVDPDCVVLVAGVQVLEGYLLIADVFQELDGGDLTVMIAEDYTDTSDPQHVAEYASEIFRKLVHQDTLGGKLATSSEAESLVLVTPGGGAPADSGAPGTSPDSCSNNTAVLTSLHTLDQKLELETPPKRPRGGEQVDRTCRCALMDWLVEEHHKLQLRMETLFLAARLVDRFLLRRRVASRDLRLVGAAGLLIAAKFEEIYPPEIRDLVYTTQEYTVEDVKLMEVIMLSVLEFSIAGQTAAHFMERYLRASRCSELEGRLVRYALELSLVDESSVQYSPSHLASAAVLLANRLSGRLPTWPAALVNYSGQTEEALQPCAGELQKLLREARHSRFQRVRGKLTKDPPLLELVRAIETAVA